MRNKSVFSLLSIAGIFFAGTTSAQVVNTINVVTISHSCLVIPDGVYTVSVNYFKPPTGWVPGPGNTTYNNYSNIVVKTSAGTTTLDFSAASPTANFSAINFSSTNGTIKINNAFLSWQSTQINCAPLPVTLEYSQSTAMKISL
jgi:hypothetical protein